MIIVVQNRTSYSRTRVLMGAPIIEQGGHRYQPTAVRYSWSDSAPQPLYVEVLARKLKKDGTPGATVSPLGYRLEGTANGGFRLAPGWVAELVVTA